MDECSVCLESFDLDLHIPKSMDCRHAMCTECVMNKAGNPLQRCPICRQDIINPSALPNDLSIIAYLEKEHRGKYLKERKEKIKNLGEKALKAYGDLDGLLKADSFLTVETDRGAVFKSYIKHLFEKCQDSCGSKRFLTDAATKHRNKLENTLHELQMSMAACTSLLDNPHVTKDDIDRCESQAVKVLDKVKDGGRYGASEGAMWNSYSQLLMETFAEIIKEPPSSDNSFTGGSPDDSNESKSDPPLNKADIPHILSKRKFSYFCVTESVICTL